jgi:tripartite-type tricarboxylate transporter receptor subunit TctC
MISSKHVLRIVVAGFVALCTAVATAQTFPTRPLRIVVPYEPGSTVDTTSRMIADALSKRLGQPVIVENRTGGQGMIAMNALLNAPADGYTLMADTPALAINPSVYKVKYDPIKDLEPVAQLMSLPFVVVMSPAVPATNLKEFIALAKQKPGEFNIAPGGTSTLLASELFGLKAGIKMQVVNYKGAASAITAVMRDECQIAVFDVANLAPQIRAGKLRGLVTAGANRSEVIPDVPTAKEVGLEGFDVSTWFGMFAKKGTPPELVAKLNNEIREVLAQPAFVNYMKARGAVPTPLTAPEFTKFFHSEVALWRNVVQTSGVKME